MVLLLRNLTNVSQHTGEYDHLPSGTDITPTADVARIKYYRNKLAHCEDGKIDNVSFETAWHDTSEVRT